MIVTIGVSLYISNTCQNTRTRGTFCRFTTKSGNRDTQISVYQIHKTIFAYPHFLCGSHCVGGSWTIGIHEKKDLRLTILPSIEFGSYAKINIRRRRLWCFLNLPLLLLSCLWPHVVSMVRECLKCWLAMNPWLMSAIRYAVLLSLPLFEGKNDDDESRRSREAVIVRRSL